MLRRVTLAFLVAGVATLGSAQAAAALTCVPPPPASEQFQRAHAAVLGQVIEMELLGPEPAFNSYLIGRTVRYRIQVLEVHKGRQWLSASEEIDAFGAYYGHLGYPPQPPTQPFAFLLNRGPAGWGTPYGALCAGGISVEDLRRLGAENPEPDPRDRYIPGPPRPPVCKCGPWVRFRLVGTTEHRLRRALKRGIKFNVGCSRKCRFTAHVSMGGRAAKRHQLARGRNTVTVATGSAHLERGEHKTVTVRFTPRAKVRLIKLRRVELTLRTSFRAGNRTARSVRPLTLTASRTQKTPP